MQGLGVGGKGEGIWRGWQEGTGTQLRLPLTTRQIPQQGNTVCVRCEARRCYASTWATLLCSSLLPKATTGWRCKTRAQSRALNSQAYAARPGLRAEPWTARLTLQDQGSEQSPEQPGWRCKTRAHCIALNSQAGAASPGLRAELWTARLALQDQAPVQSPEQPGWACT